MTIEIQNLSKRFADFPAVYDVSMRVEEGSLTALLGPSGSGKTTVLRMIAGLEIPDAGRILVGGQDITNVRAQHRNIGFVFQQYALFKHMRVAENIAFPLRVRKWHKDAIRERVAELLRLLRLDGLDKRYPSQISGGQRQRVALARALASRPQVLLLDEPFSALDARVRDELRDWLRGLHEQLHVTSVFVTHDQKEAMELADQIAIMSDGKLIQEGTPEDIVGRPANSLVMNFLGRANMLTGSAQHGVANIHGVQVRYEAAGGTAVPVIGYFWPQQVALTAEPTASSLRTRVVRVLTAGLHLKVHLETEQTRAPFVVEVDAAVQQGLTLEPGSLLYATPWNLQVYPGADARSVEQLVPQKAFASGAV